ncbi:MAG: amidohydrolase family protein, partial [Caulobacteraceae bacterium]|nr:amidohydrolase family protein [Caulobacteraceae bacterium]
MSFIFSADGHFVEPKELYVQNISPDLARFGIRSEKEGDYMVTRAGSSVLNRSRINSQPRLDKNGDQFSRANRLGASNIEVRLEELAGEGIDAEIIFPSTAMFTSLIENTEAEAATARIYNDWHHDTLKDRTDRFVRCGVIPVRDVEGGVAEMKRMASLGFTSAMLPSFMPRDLPMYNHERWDAIFEAAQQLRMVLVLHTGSGRADADIREEKGPGGAIVNYTIQMCDAQKALMYMIAGGALDRFPGAKVAVIESGASWLAALAERMDECNEAHDMFVRPKLSLTPSQIIRRQVHASFQYDRACIMSRSVTGHQALLWG